MISSAAEKQIVQRETITEIKLQIKNLIGAKSQIPLTIIIQKVHRKKKKSLNMTSKCCVNIILLFKNYF